jgi:surface carbohydrate biosynthesis protein
MRKRILLVDQHIRRGVDANALISAYLEGLGLHTRLALTGAQLCSHLLRFEPHVVYYPWVTPYVYQFLRSRENSVPIVNAYQEQNTVLHSPDAQMVQWADKSDYLFAWGEAHEHKFEELFNEPDVRLTGNPRFDPYLDASIAHALYPSRQQLAKRYNLDASQAWILLALDFPLLFRPEDRLKRLIERGDLSTQRLRLTREIYEFLSGWIRRFVTEDHDVTLIVRPHPGSDLKQIKQDFGGETESVRYIRGGAIPPWIIASDRYVTRASTSIVEAWIADTRAALIQKDKAINEGEVRPHLREAEKSIDSYSEFKNYIEDGGHGGSRTMHHDFLSSHYRLDGRSALRTAQELKQIASEQKTSVTYSGGRAENLLEHAKFATKKFLNESGLNRWNPLDRPNDEFLSKDRARRKVESIAVELNLNGEDEAVQ